MVHAVPNFYRVAALVNELAVRYLYIIQDHFLDDFFLIEPPYSALNAADSCCELCDALGVDLGPEKAH